MRGTCPGQQEMLREFLTIRGFPVTCLNGAMGLEERQRVQREFAGQAQILISTDAGGEGLNLQFCHVVVGQDGRRSIQYALAFSRPGSSAAGRGA